MDIFWNYTILLVGYMYYHYHYHYDVFIIFINY